MTENTTIYLDHFPTLRWLMIQRYRAKPREGWTRKDSERLINQLSYINYGPDYQNAPRNKLVVDCLARYRDLLRETSDISSISFHTAEKLICKTPQTGEILCHIRHDVDFDLVTALELAKIEHEYDIKSTFYILHTAPYYGFLKEGCRFLKSFSRSHFARHERNVDIYLEMQDLGHEIGLHTDSLKLYQTHNIDGAQAIRTELEWLRSKGLNITGSASHNSLAVYGADNSAIFRGRPIHPRRKEEVHTGVIHDGKWAPLNVLDENELGLEYEASDFFNKKEFEIYFFSITGQNEWYCRNFNVDGPGIARQDAWRCQDQVVDKIRNDAHESMVILTIHPVYYGFRSSDHHYPTDKPLNITEPPPHESLGWKRQNAYRLFAYAPDDGCQEYQSIIHTNQDGMFDVSNMYLKHFEKKILFCGRTNIHARTVSVGSKISQVVSKWCWRQHGCQIGATSVAAPDANAMTLCAWASDVLRFNKDIRTVFFPVGANDLILNNRSLFCQLWSTSEDDTDIFFPQIIDGKSIEAFKNSSFSNIHDANWSNQLRRSAEGFFASEGDVLWNSATKFMMTAIRWLQSVDISVILLVDECGESCGLWDWRHGSKKLRMIHSFAHRRFNDLADQLNVPLVDPYEHFLSDESSARSHWKTACEWSLHGHDLAAQAVIAELDRAGILKSRASV